jgi:hypothetical protein
MNPHYAAMKTDINDAAWWYWQQGISVIPCKGKVPNIATWQQYQQRRASRAELNGWLNAGKFESIGIICGAVSSNLVVLDLDGLDAVAAFDLKFGTMGTYAVTSGSGKGKHVYFQCQTLPKTTRVNLGPKYAFELRANGCYVIAPPSLHESGNRYMPENDAAVKLYPNLEAMRQWIHGMIRQKYQQSGQQPPKPLPVERPGKWTSRDAYMRDAYLKVAIRRQVDMTINALPGNRNTQLYMSAQTLGQLVAGGELDRNHIESMLLNAAVTIGLDEIEAGRTIASGIDAGAAQPRRVPPAPPKKA